MLNKKHGNQYEKFTITRYCIFAEHHSQRHKPWSHKKAKNCHVIYLSGKPMIPHLLCCRRFAIADYGFTFGALDLQHPRLLQP